jgi:BirA family transcriptional regulator, biotin operon repressor / biotin---[acetyl-CoA-carboxylase] ligase
MPSLYASAESIWQAAMALPDGALAGFSVEVLPEVDSTNSELMRRARAGRSEPVLLVAQQQTAGRGRLGRSWYSGAAPSDRPQAGAGQADPAASAPNASLTFSIGLPLQPQSWEGLSLAVGVSIAESLHPDIRLKWPNDLWWQGRKLAGILIETASIGTQRYAVVGVGINMAPRPAAGLSTPPAWLQELQPAAQAAQVLERVAAPLLHDLLHFERAGFTAFAKRFAARDALRGRSVTVFEPALASAGSVDQDRQKAPHSELFGQMQGVDSQGALLLQTAQGMQRIHSCEVSVRAV